jgi:ABC-type dipeptide/oligopeptide/nickel transport system permease component
MFVVCAFDITGLERPALASLPRRDLPLVLGVVIAVSLVVAVAALPLDVVLAIVDPRIAGALSSAAPSV